MLRPPPSTSTPPATLAKCPSGIRGLDQITGGGLPRGRPTLICGGAGSGKTLLGVEFLVHGALESDEPGLFVSFEENPGDLAKNTASLGFDLEALIASGKLQIEHVIESGEILEAGEYDLDGLFIRLGAAIDAIGAKRVVLDTIEVLFGALSNMGILRMELHRLFCWLKDKGVTTIVTGERGDGALTRHGLEEYVSDCVIVLDQRVTDQITTRRLRIVKYRGSAHGTNEYPFVIDRRGFAVLPITEVALNYTVADTYVSSGIAKFDAMLSSGGYYRGSTVMLSGMAGTGKSSIAAQFVDAACRRGEVCLYFALEESPDQIMRNMRSLGIDLKRWVERGLLRFSATRPTTLGLDAHINMILAQVEDFAPQIVVVDPASAFESAGTGLDVQTMLMRLIDQLKSRQITALMTCLMRGAQRAQVLGFESGVSSLVDTWIMVRDVEQAGERTRGLYIIKSRGMKHSKQIRELLITDHGVDLEDVCVGPGGVLIGSSRAAQRMHDHATAEAANRHMEARRAQHARRQVLLQARIAQLEAEFAAETQDMDMAIAQDSARQQTDESDRAALEADRNNVVQSRGDVRGEAKA